MNKHLRDILKLYLFLAGSYVLLMLAITVHNVWPVGSYSNKVYQLMEIGNNENKNTRTKQGLRR
jgi:hypothetical protein